MLIGGYMRSKVFIGFFAMGFIFMEQPAGAYMDTHPPFTAKSGIYSPLKGHSLVDISNPDYRSSDGRIQCHVKRSIEKGFWDFLLQDGDTVLAKRHIDYAPIPFSVYYTDINGDGEKDFVVLMTYMAMGMSFLHERVEIFLKKKEGGYAQIAYDAVAVGLEDFVDLDRDGKREILVTGFYYQDSGRSAHAGHNYFSYNIYEFDGYRLKNADEKYKGFPKFIRFTNKPNSKDSADIVTKERQKQSQLKNISIIYKDIP